MFARLLGVSAFLVMVAAACTGTGQNAVLPIEDSTVASGETPAPVSGKTKASSDGRSIEGWEIFAVDYVAREASTYSAGGGWFFTWGGSPDRSGLQPPDGLLFDVGGSQFHPVLNTPLPPRGLPSSVWTGEEFIVFGGHSFDESFIDGAACNPRTRNWRTISPAPLQPAAHPAAVWAQSEMIVWLPERDSGFGELPSAGAGQVAAYDPGNDTWDVLPSPPIGVIDAVLLIAGDEVLLMGGHRCEIWAQLARRQGFRWQRSICRPSRGVNV